MRLPSENKIYKYDKIQFIYQKNANEGRDNIIEKLTAFGYKRNTKEAIIFYIAYLIAIMIFSILFALILTSIGLNMNYSTGQFIGNLIAIVVSLVVSFMILKEKNLLGNYVFVLLALLSGVLAVFFGGLGGLIPVSYLTTIPAN